MIKVFEAIIVLWVGGYGHQIHYRLGLFESKEAFERVSEELINRFLCQNFGMGNPPLAESDGRVVSLPGKAYDAPWRIRLSECEVQTLSDDSDKLINEALTNLCENVEHEASRQRGTETFLAKKLAKK